MSKSILCLDFDGVVHSYTSPWTSATEIPDPPVPGAMKFIDDALDWFTVAIYSSRSHQIGGIEAMKEYVRGWMSAYAMSINHEAISDDGQQFADDVVREIQWPTEKPTAFVSIDDRGLTFNGRWPNPENLLGFRPWNKRTQADVAPTGMIYWAMAPQDDTE